ncbi:MAG: LysR family transcriptional regulator [Treponemataceae bacterium]|nr:LysR family transcriptional regulator [Treponemataceae bacterium]
MNTTQLECFVSLASTLNFAKTAEQVYLTQPAVTKEIQALEAELSARLFIRTTRSVSLTEVGHQFLPEANSILNSYYHAKDWISSFHSKSKNSLRIGYMDSHQLPFINKVLGKIKGNFEKLLPSFILDQTDSNLNRLLHGQTDLVIGIRDSKFSDNSIEFKTLHRDGFLLVFPKNHPLVKIAKKQKLTEISQNLIWDYPQVVQIPPYLLKNVFSKGSHIIPVNEKLDNIICSFASEVYALVKENFGFALVPEYLAIPDRDLVFYPFKETHRASFGIYYRKESLEAKDSAVSHFLQEASEMIN